MVRIVKNNVGRKMVRIVQNNVGTKMVRIVQNNVSFAFSFLLFFIFAFLRVQSVFLSPPQLPMTSYLKRFPSQILFISYFVLSYFMLKSQYFPFMLSAKQGKCWYNLITSSVWQGLYQGLNLGLLRTRCQHSTTRLSRRRKIAYSKISCFSKSVKFLTYLLNQLILFMIHGIGISVFDLYFNF